MLPRADIVGTRPVASVEATKPIIPIGDAQQELAQRLNRAALGTQFRAEVLSHLTDDSFVVKVADTAVRLTLPAGTQVGETLDLTLVTTQPRPTFLLGTAAGENSTTLSSTGRLVDWILHTAQATGTPKALVGKTPLAPSADVPPEQLAKAMKNTLASSGLFYESHVEQWASGERPLMTLLSEPQAKNGNLSLLVEKLRAAANAGAPAPEHAAKGHGFDAAQTDKIDLARILENLHDQPEAARSLMDLLRSGAQSSPNAPPAEAGTAAEQSSGAQTDTTSTALMATAADPGGDTAGTASAAAQQLMPEIANRPETLSNESVQTINQQLSVLEQQRVVWQGELWPGQKIEWEVGEDAPQGKHADDGDRAWQSVVRFELPTLGKLSAAIRLAGGRLQIQVRAVNEETASILRANGDALSSALDAAGSPLEMLTVKRDETA